MNDKLKTEQKSLFSVIEKREKGEEAVTFQLFACHPFIFAATQFSLLNFCSFPPFIHHHHLYYYTTTTNE
jgi:hypothetical protein